MTYKTPNAQQRVYFIWADMGLGSSLFLVVLYRVDRTFFQSPKQNKHSTVMPNFKTTNKICQ